jgi:hypothetical protein
MPLSLMKNTNTPTWEEIELAILDKDDWELCEKLFRKLQSSITDSHQRALASSRYADLLIAASKQKKTSKT